MNIHERSDSDTKELKLSNINSKNELVRFESNHF
jgi:hypothetical protein